MLIGGWPGSTTVFRPRAAGRRTESDPLIQDARDRQRRRRRRILLLVVAAIVIGYGINHWTRTSNAGLACISTHACSLQRLSNAPPLPNPCSLLTAAQVVPTIGGKVQSRVLGHSYGAYGPPTCTWTGPSMGYMETRETITVQLSRVTKAKFNFINLQSIPPATPISGVRALAYSSPSGIAVWRAGAAIEMDGPWFTVYPVRAVQLALSALQRS